MGVNCSGSGLSRYLRESTIVPYVTMMRETVPDITQTTFLDILSDRVERLFFRNLELGIGPTRNFNDHVENPIRLISEKGNVVPGGNDRSVLLDENTMFCILRCQSREAAASFSFKKITERVGSTDEAGGVLYMRKS